jgi:hypothetical protein
MVGCFGMANGDFADGKRVLHIRVRSINVCDHHYVIPHGKFGWCLGCKTVVEVKEEKTTNELVMPPRIFEITEALWKIISPWPLLPFPLVECNGWYISMINGLQYLIMPIRKANGDDTCIFFSARKLSKEDGQKYLYPTGVAKSYFVSMQKPEKDVIVICEGVADAVYCSPIGTSVALLGVYYNGSLGYLFDNRDVAFCLDGDSAGLLAAMRIMGEIKNAKSKKLVLLPEGADPTDIPIEELKKLILT